MIVQNASIGGTTDVSFTIHEDELENARTILMPVIGQIGAKRLNTAAGMAKLSVVGIGMRSHSGVAARMFECLGNKRDQHPAGFHLGNQDCSHHR